MCIKRLAYLIITIKRIIYFHYYLTLVGRWLSSSAGRGRGICPFSAIGVHVADVPSLRQMPIHLWAPHQSRSHTIPRDINSSGIKYNLTVHDIILFISNFNALKVIDYNSLHFLMMHTYRYFISLRLVTWWEAIRSPILEWNCLNSNLPLIQFK